MASQYFRLLDPTTLKPDMVQERSQVVDCGAYKTLEIQRRVLKAGSAGTLTIQHSAVNEESSWIDLVAGLTLGATSSAYNSATGFLRYIRWVTDSNVAGEPVALIDIIAKE